MHHAADRDSAHMNQSPMNELVAPSLWLRSLMRMRLTGLVILGSSIFVGCGPPSPMEADEDPHNLMVWGYVMARYVARRAAIRDTAIRSEGRAAASVSWRRRGKTSLGGLTPRASLHRLRWQLPWHQPNAQWSLVLQRRMSFGRAPVHRCRLLWKRPGMVLKLYPTT